MTKHAEPQLEDGPADVAMPAVVWRFGAPRAVLSSAPVGGGNPAVAWLLNTRVATDYDREDLDQHATELASHFGLLGPGIAMFTAADVTKLATRSVGGVF